MVATKPSGRRFQLVLIKPSHYDDDGYVVQWLRSSIPSNSLAVMYTLAADAASRQPLGPDVAIDITAFDETNTRVNVKKLIAQLRRYDDFGMIGLVGVQSNQFPRALEIARPFRAAGIPVVMGGFHVSGCLAMLPEMQPDLQAALDLGVTLFAGEAEGRLETLLRDVAAGALAPIYNYLDDLPALEDAPTPFLPRAVIGRTIKHHASFDAGRGCPFQCSFCTIINVQGRKSRRRSPDDVERLIKQHWAEGVRRFFITDDNFARNKDWEAIFDRIIQIRERDKIKVRLIIQVDTLCHKLPNFVAKAARAGVTRVFIGLENINPTNLLQAKKRQNRITEYRTMLLDWKRAGVITYAGYILGFPADTPESIRRDIEIIKKELPLDILEFFCLTPLPGSEDHKVLWQKGAWMDPDMNKYDLEHVVADHPLMSHAAWHEVYRSAWQAYYTPEHMTTILRRAAASGMGMHRLAAVLFFFSSYPAVEKLHPLQGGIFRLKYRRDRRPTFPMEPVWAFYPKYWWETASKHVRMAQRWFAIDFMRRRILRDPQHRAYMDQALTAVADDDAETLDLLTQNDAARREVDRAKRIGRPKVAVGV
ncbi:MAG TPA: radical SAM protein [Acetobacteraceae bacterium]|nr:radical SAM protein [Acetobacteraceae bacterium]